MTANSAPGVAQNRTLAAAGAMTGYAAIIGFTDNCVRFVASDIGLWQFHATRTGVVLLILLAAVPVLGLRVRPVSAVAVALRSLVHGIAMMCYFGSLAFLPVAQGAAGLFTAPIFVLLLSRFAFGQRISPARVIAVVLGFGGIVLVLGLGQGDWLAPAAVLPLMGGFFYALGNIATRRWCAEETAETLTLGFFLALGLFGLIGMAVLSVVALPVADGTAGFVLRGPVALSGTVLLWIVVQALGALIGVGLMVKAYQLTDASRAGVFEYIVLPAAALWGWALWDQVPSVMAVMGMGLIFAAGLLIALRGS